MWRNRDQKRMGRDSCSVHGAELVLLSFKLLILGLGRDQLTFSKSNQLLHFTYTVDSICRSAGPEIGCSWWPRYKQRRGHRAVHGSEPGLPPPQLLTAWQQGWSCWTLALDLHSAIANVAIAQSHILKRKFTTFFCNRNVVKSFLFVFFFNTMIMVVDSIVTDTMNSLRGHIIDLHLR